MKNIELLENLKVSKVAVLGLGKSNIPLVKFLLDLGVTDITIYDKKPWTELGKEAREYNEKGVKFVGGEGYLDVVEGDYIFRTPGIRDDVPSIVKAVEGGAVLQAFGSARPKTEENYCSSKGTTYKGRMLAVLHHTEGGVATLRICADGYGEAVLNF